MNPLRAARRQQCPARRWGQGRKTFRQRRRRRWPSGSCQRRLSQSAAAPHRAMAGRLPTTGATIIRCDHKLWRKEKGPPTGIYTPEAPPLATWGDDNDGGRKGLGGTGRPPATAHFNNGRVWWSHFPLTLSPRRPTSHLLHVRRRPPELCAANHSGSIILRKLRRRSEVNGLADQLAEFR